MAVAKQTFNVYQGSDFRKVLVLKDESEALMDLTGYTFRGQVKSAYSDSSAVVSFSFTIRDQGTDQGKVDMSLDAADTSALSISKKTNYIYDLEMVDISGIVTRFLEGQLIMWPEVTK
jgi:hypothetical protein